MFQANRSYKFGTMKAVLVFILMAVATGCCYGFPSKLEREGNQPNSVGEEFRMLIQDNQYLIGHACTTVFVDVFLQGVPHQARRRSFVIHSLGAEDKA